MRTNPLTYLLPPILLLAVLAGVLVSVVDSTSCTMAGRTFGYGAGVGVTASGDVYTVPSPVPFVHVWSCTDRGWMRDW